MAQTTSDLIGALEYILPHLRELARIEAHANKGNPTHGHHAQICINNVRNALLAAQVAA
jgi:hypothetical protein